MNRKKTDSIIVSGLGISGLITASLFCEEDITVECFEPRDISKISDDQRTTAFLNPAISVFKKIGIWESVKPFAQPLKEMEIVDAGFLKNEKMTSVIFNPNEIGAESFGYNIPNKIVSSELLNWLRNKKNFVLNAGDSLIDHYAYDDNVLVKSEKGKTVEAQLLISCEGRESATRKREKITTFQASYDQSAMVFQVSHSNKHNDRTTEILDKGGPFTIIPLRNSSNQLKSTVVWMDSS